MSDANLRASIHATIDDIDETAWDRLVPCGHPHLRHRFLSLAEQSGSVSNATGWQPCHIALRQDDQLLAAMPLYQKGHSWGEFVFDWSWAQAYERAGLAYYPKLISASPFTPASSPKLLIDSSAEPELRAALLSVAVGFAEEHEFSSLHLQFLNAQDREYCEQKGLLVRKDCQFHWFNKDYTDFDDFLASFSSKKRKNVRRERRLVHEAGIQHRRLAGDEITSEQMARAFELCSRTFHARGHEPYLNLDFFEALRRCDNSPIVLVAGERDDQMVAAAILLREDDVLLGRYWGAADHYDSLHFETCYYQGIEYCIEQQIRCYEPGTQGEHKVARGFVPTEVGSAHWLAQPAFADAIADYLDREASGVASYMDAINAHTPFRRTDGDPAE